MDQRLKVSMGIDVMKLVGQNWIKWSWWLLNKLIKWNKLVNWNKLIIWNKWIKWDILIQCNKNNEMK